jgi:hypothetical protein
MSARTNELVEANQSLSRRLDTATRNAEENRLAFDDMTMKLERHQKRSHEELERLDEELVLARAERDTFDPKPRFVRWKSNDSRSIERKATSSTILVDRMGPRLGSLQPKASKRLERTVERKICLAIEWKVGAS